MPYLQWLAPSHAWPRLFRIFEVDYIAMQYQGEMPRGLPSSEAEEG
jgi:hypothetical protein